LNDYFPHEVDERRKPRRQVVIFDQLEELFNLIPDTDNWSEQQQNFFKQVGDALENDPLLRIVFVTREDYLASSILLHLFYLKT